MRVYNRCEEKCTKPKGPVNGFSESAHHMTKEVKHGQYARCPLEPPLNFPLALFPQSKPLLMVTCTVFSELN